MTDPLERYERTHPTRRIGQIDWTPAGQSDTGTHVAGDPCPVGPFPHPIDPSACYAISLYAPDPASADLFPVTFTEPVSHTHPASWTDAATINTCPACLDELGTELEAEYRAAIERNRDRAQEARAGGHDIRHHYARQDFRPADVTPQGEIMRDADQWHANQYRAARAERDAVRQRHDDYDPSAAR